MQVLSLEELSHSYQTQDGRVLALKHINFEVRAQESVAILGPSGAGKSTLLQIIDGLLKPTEGSVYIDGNKLEGPREHTALILQDLGLFPWKTVLDNASVGLEVRGMSKAQAHKKAREVLKKVELSHVEKLYPQELSGGMKQRLAIARALILDCDLLLMDEPLSALDALLRERMQNLLIEMQKEYKYAQIIVTHSIEEAVLLGDKIIVMDEKPGQIIDIISNPKRGESSYRDSQEMFMMTKLLREKLKSSLGEDIHE